MVQSKIKVYKILSQPRDILALFRYDQITAAKQTRLAIHSFTEERVECYIWSLGITDRF